MASAQAKFLEQGSEKQQEAVSLLSFLSWEGRGCAASCLHHLGNVA